MKKVKYIIYRYLTNTDFFNINKPRGTEERGGGQRYVDFNTTKIPVEIWDEFFENISGLTREEAANGPRWVFPIFSMGVNEPHDQSLEIFQRRSATVCIAAQNLSSRNSNRVLAWHPNNGFPYPGDPRDRHQLPDGLAIYLVRTYDGEIWAGWLVGDSGNGISYRSATTQSSINSVFGTNHSPGDAAFLSFPDGQLMIDTAAPQTPFILMEGVSVTPEQLKESRARYKPSRRSPRASTTRRKPRTEDELIGSLFDDDIANERQTTREQRVVTRTVRKRNQKAVKALKELYNHECQASGTAFVFKKKDGVNYTEAHHLIPLGLGGADDPRNIVVVSALIHRMLHYAEVPEIDLSKAVTDASGWTHLDVTINSDTYTIKWHPEHAKRVLETKG